MTRAKNVLLIGLFSLALAASLVVTTAVAQQGGQTSPGPGSTGTVCRVTFQRGVT